MEYTWVKNLITGLRDLSSDDELSFVNAVKRAPYFNKYRIAIHLSASTPKWPDFPETVQRLTGALVGLDCRRVSILPAMCVSLYTNDSQVLRILLDFSEDLDISSIDIVQPGCWGLITKPRNKGKFYHQYSYRIKMNHEISSSDYQGIMVGQWRISGPFLYCEYLRDVVMVKLISGSDILHITERP